MQAVEENNTAIIALISFSTSILELLSDFKADETPF